ncbi:MAG TPA: SBBP repeat-containing protein [Bryobacteraceae bacterium]|nr:SBBP repeat-containing protein [Bryobacteraceae bacterium]
MKSGSEAWFEEDRIVIQQKATVVVVRFAGSTRSRITAERPSGAKANYLLGQKSGNWRTDIPLFNEIRYTGLWPGIELSYESDGAGLSTKFEIAPGADPGLIRLEFNGPVRLLGSGQLRVRNASGVWMENRPAFYQIIDGVGAPVEGAYQTLENNTVGFKPGQYDRSKPLIVGLASLPGAPSTLFSGYFGGASQDTITSVAIDALNNIVVAGWTSSTNLPAANGAQKVYSGGVDAFVASFLPNGGGLIYCTYIGGAGDDRAFGVAIDAARNVYLTGWTSSANFPVRAGFQTHLRGTRDAFVTKLNAAGNTLTYSTYLGGSGVDVGYAIAVDSTNSAIIVGDSTSPDLPTTSAAWQKKTGGSQDVFVAKLTSQGNNLTFLTYAGGSGIDHGSCISINSAGQVYFGGYTLSSNFPTRYPFQSHLGGGQDGFFAKLSADGGTIIQSSYLGGYGTDEVNAIFVDASYNLVVAGTTGSANFPVTPGAFQTTFGGQTDGFIARFASSQRMSESTFLGGSLNDGISAVTQDFHGYFYLTGTTDSPDFPLQNPLQATDAGGMDAFVVKMDNKLSSILFGTYLGGTGNDGGNAIAVDFETSIAVVGQTGSQDFPVVGTMQSSSSEILSSFVTKFAPSFTIGVAYGSTGQLTITTDPWHVAAYTQSTTFGNATDLPIAADWNGSGKKKVGVFRNGTWILDMDGSGTIDSNSKQVQFGQAGDIPVVGDWLGTGHIALGLFRQGTFILDLSGHLSGVPTGQSDATFSFGQGGDVPIAADWNGSGTTKVGVFRNGLWLVDYTGSRVYSSARGYVYGQAGDLPVVGDWDSSGHPSKIGIYRNGLWVLDYDGDNVWTVPYLNEMVIGFGTTGYTPLIF